MKLLLIGSVALAILFVAGVVAPRRSVRLQRWFQRVSRRGETRAERRGTRSGEWTARSLQRFRKGGDRSAEGGRNVHDRIERGTRAVADRVRGDRHQ